MTLDQQYLQLTKKICNHISIPPVVSVHLPNPIDDAENPDKFGFIFLQDGSVGPFYTSLEDSLQQLWQQIPDGKTLAINTVELIQYLATDSLGNRALAIGAFNAMSQHLMQRTAYSPVANNKASSTGLSKPKAGESVGMVGYFCPLVEQFLVQGTSVVVLEKNPARVELADGLTLTTRPEDLAQCQHVLCTASTLINGSLPDILKHCQKKTLSLIGPSGSGLPDILFQHGVQAVGGIQFFDLPALHEALHTQQSWGHAGNKYQLTPHSYPGVDYLLQVIRVNKCSTGEN